MRAHDHVPAAHFRETLGPETSKLVEIRELAAGTIIGILIGRQRAQQNRRFSRQSQLVQQRAPASRQIIQCRDNGVIGEAAGDDKLACRQTCRQTVFPHREALDRDRVGIAAVHDPWIRRSQTQKLDRHYLGICGTEKMASVIS